MRQNKNKFGLFIRELRIKKNIGQRDLAKKIGVSPSYLNDIEKEKRSAPKLNVIKKISKKTYDVSARLSVEDLEKKIGGYFSDEEKEDIDTVGGLVFNLLGKIPSRGEVINHKSGLEFTIQDADTRKIKRILVNVK